MNIPSRINEIEAALQGKMTIATFCYHARINRVTWHRWKRGSSSPLMTTWEQVESAVSRLPELVAMEAARTESP